MRAVCALVLFLALLHLSSSLLLAAFNIQSFGKTKAENPDLMDIISTIVRRYDIILIQEVRDSDLVATDILMKFVNKGSHVTYKGVVSQPLGRSIYHKEQYLFLYRAEKVSVTDSYLFSDTKSAFSRKPFVVRFSSKLTTVENFVLIPQHTSPDFAAKEVDALYDVVDDVRTRWKTNDIVLLGDFNAGDNYIKNNVRDKIRLFTDKSFHWLITNDAKTSLSDTGHAYDRIVVTSDMMRGVVPDSARVYNFMVDLKLKKELAKAVSDHFPVEVELKEKP